LSHCASASGFEVNFQLPKHRRRDELVRLTIHTWPGIYFITLDALLKTPTTAEVMLGADTAIAIAIKASMIAYSTIVTPDWDFFRRLLGAIRLFIPIVLSLMEMESCQWASGTLRSCAEILQAATVS
jgi:hypothetical protein